MRFYKYQGAGNDFLVADNRDGSISLSPDYIQKICDRRYGVGADGVMLLENAEGYDFRMVYYNSDGSGGMMCGNGGRCIVAFADFCGLPVGRFMAADGHHEAEIIERKDKTLIVRLKMKDVSLVVDHPEFGGLFMDTGTRHFVKPVDSVASTDVKGIGQRIRWAEAFAPQGVNVNFIEGDGRTLLVRTFEKGVEDETYACGTGITASAIAAWRLCEYNSDMFDNDSEPFRLDFDMDDDTGIVRVPVKALRDNLAVEFLPTAFGAEDVWLIGPATLVAAIDIL